MRKKRRGRGETGRHPPTFPSRASLIFALFVLIRPHYTTVSERLTQATFGWVRKVIKAGEGRERREDWGGSNEKPTARTGAVLSSLYACVRIVPIEYEYSS